MLSLCRAYLVAQTDAQDRTLKLLTGRVGFTEIGSARDGDPILSRSPQRVDFFFIHHRLSDAAMQAVIATVRASPKLSLRFAPIVLITDDQPFETILKYIEFGFDDIVTLPAKPAELTSRFIAQLNTDQVYIETEYYLGPDRRRFESASHADNRRLGDASFQRITVRRNPATGVKVVRHEVVIGQSRREPQRQFGSSRRSTQVSMF